MNERGKWWPNTNTPYRKGVVKEDDDKELMKKKKTKTKNG